MGQMTPFKVTRTTPVQEIMTYYQTKLFIPIERQHLTLSGVRLDKNRTIGDYNFNDGDVIELRIQIGGGVPLVPPPPATMKVGRYSCRWHFNVTFSRSRP
jgi:hypothetical protein